MTQQHTKKTIPLYSISLSLEDIRKIVDRLSTHVGEQGDAVVSGLTRPEDQDEALFEEHKRSIRHEAFRITVTVEGADGSSLFGNGTEVFSSPNLPDKISTIYMTNITAYREVARARPSNSFDFILDFSKPPLLDGKNLVSSPTANLSQLTVDGDRDSWVASISDAVMGVIGNRRSKRAWLHRAFVYDFGLLLLGLPAGLYVCWKMSDFIGMYLGSISGFLSATAYLYIVLVVAWAYRIFFGYTKWAFPSVELIGREDAAKKHRGFWYVIATGMVAQLLWEVLPLASFAGKL